MAKLTRKRRIALRAAGALVLLGFAAFAFHALTGLGGETLFGTWIYCAVMVGAAASCLTRAALVRRERPAWLLIGAGLLIWTGGEIYYEASLSLTGSVPIPSPADAGYLLFYPLTYAGLIVLLRERIGSFPFTRWLDGLIAGLAVAALVATLALGPIAAASDGGSSLATATNLAYPICDLTLLTLVVTAAAFTGWRPGATWSLLGAGMIVLAGSDVAYLLQSAQGTYVEGGSLDAAWPLGALLLAGAAWAHPPATRRVVPRGMRVAAVPVAAAVLAMGVLAAERSGHLPAAAEVLAFATLLLVIARLALALRRAGENLAASEREASSDELTGLANRRALTADLEAAVGGAPAPGSSHLLAMFDLDGFKLYNDTFGHPTGDALLARLGGRLDRFAAAHGRAYRLGGDEFCLLCECSPAEVEPIVAGALAALSERGEGFDISASQGSVLIPSEADSTTAAMQLADRRMYADKVSERTSAGSQSRDVLLTALRERRPQLAEQAIDLGELASEVTEELGLSAEERDETCRAAQLHEVGKMAVPDAILNKAGPLEDSEWEFIHRHPLIGERIIGSAAALVPVARLVRSVGERWDGGGYPDALAGEQIPLGSRVVAVCAAYAAMITERPHSVAMLPERALEELRRGAGSQFDPEVVAAFGRAAARRGSADEDRAGPARPAPQST
ncbi:MAG TPA: HD domain-containing phosphohydrolase [Solirubrobacterales bacterium]|nr:HD domain-containing phosphohydrolase [Solirubrobacterales bacterium]